jgi:hypothetical protein
MDRRSKTDGDILRRGGDRQVARNVKKTAVQRQVSDPQEKRDPERDRKREQLHPHICQHP